MQILRASPRCIPGCSEKTANNILISRVLRASGRLSLKQCTCRSKCDRKIFSTIIKKLNNLKSEEDLGLLVLIHLALWLLLFDVWKPKRVSLPCGIITNICQCFSWIYSFIRKNDSLFLSLMLTLNRNRTVILNFVAARWKFCYFFSVR